MSRATPDISDDCMLINELKGGSSRAFDMIFRKYYDNLCRFTFSMLGDADLSQGLVLVRDISIPVFVHEMNKQRGQLTGRENLQK